MSPSRQAKAAGLKSLSEVSEKTGVSLQTLGNWHKHKPKLFAVVLAGCKESPRLSVGDVVAPFNPAATIPKCGQCDVFLVNTATRSNFCPKCNCTVIETK